LPVTDEVARISYEKALAVANNIDGNSVIISADTIVELDGKLIGDGSDSNVKFGKKNGYNLGLTQPDDTIIITDDPTGSENKVLMFRDGAKADHSTVWVAVSGKEYNSNSEQYVISTFETKIFVETPKEGSGATLAQLIFVSGKTSRIVINLKAAKTGDEFTHAYFDITGSSKKFELNEWHTLRIEYHNVAEGSTLAPFAEIFVDGVSLGKKEVLNSKDNVDYNDVDGLFWKSYSSGLCTFYFDDMSYTEKKTTYPEEG